MKVKFVVDSSSDMRDAEFRDLTTVPLTISTDKSSWIDEDLDIGEMLDVLEGHKGRSYTACPGVERWMEAFEGADVVYVATITSGLSGTYNSAMVARDLYLKEHPDVKIRVFDTLSTGGEMRLLMEKLMELSGQGLPFEEVCEKADEYRKKTRLFFSLKSLHNLAQNGRINKAVASAIGVLGISIIGTASSDGMLEPISRSRGDKKVVARILAELKATGYSGGKMRISHVENESLANQLKDAVKELYHGADVLVYKARGLCSYYAERGAIMLGCEMA